ncbi:hypothetical protein KEM54_002038 [Ascosphaera aggregata]|nr:hypothetical protein KEM54_002038 [Ascosphaera aggregata]
MSFAPLATEDSYPVTRRDVNPRGDQSIDAQRPPHQDHDDDGDGKEAEELDDAQSHAPVDDAPIIGGLSRVPFSRTRTLRDAFITGGDGADVLKLRDYGARRHVNTENSTSQQDTRGPSSLRTVHSGMNTHSQNGSQRPAPRSRYSIYRDTSPSPGARRYDGLDNDTSSASNSSAMEGLSDEARKSLQDERDKKRLNSLAHRHVDKEDKTSPEPPLNVPTNWGKPRSKATSDWLAGVHDSNENDFAQDHDPLFDIGDGFSKPQQSINLPVDSNLELTSQSVQVSTSPITRPPLDDVRKNRPSNGKIQSLTRKSLSHPVLDPSPSPTHRQTQSKIPMMRHGSLSPLADISNGSNSVPPNIGPGTGRRKLRGGSRNLLNKLHRQSSPSSQQQQTPAAQKSRVIGAWVDTPAPARTTEPDVEPSKVEPVVETKGENAIAESMKHEGDENDAQPANEDQRAGMVEIDDKEAREPLRSIDNEKSVPSKPIVIPKPILKKPQLPRSALESVLEDIKTEDAESKAGDSTIESLQKLVDFPDAPFEYKPPKVRNEDIDDKKVKLEDIEGVHNLDKKNELAEEARRQSITSAALTPLDVGAFDQLDAKIQILVQRIKEAQDALTVLEKRASESLSNQATNPSSHSLTANNDYYCDKCGRQGDGRIYIAIPVPPLFRRHPRTNQIRPTLLGWISLALLFYLLVEYTLSTYLYPRHSLNCDRGICIYTNAPKFPFALLTLLWRASGLGYLVYLFWPVRVICEVTVRLLMNISGYWDGFVNDNQDTMGTVADPIAPGSVPDTDDSGLLSGLMSAWPTNWRWGALNGENPLPARVQNFPPLENDMLVDADLGMMQDEFVG